jgi:ankyrin repeat protein
MKPIAVLSAFTLAASAAETPEPPLRDLLRDGLYAEEVANDPAAATRHYEQILARFEEQRPLAANALFRLAELYRKTERKDDAIALYQRVLAQFPDATPQATLARTRLGTLGVQAVATPPNTSPAATPAAEPVEDEETKEIRRLTELAKTSPDLLLPKNEIERFAQKGWAKATRYLLERLEGTERQNLLNQALRSAAEGGQLALCQTLLEQGADPNQPADGQTLARAVWQNRVEVVKLLLQKGANPNLMPASCKAFNWSERNTDQPIGGALHAAAFHNNVPLIRLLLASGANAGLVAPDTRMTPLALYLRCTTDMSLEIVRLLLDHGADPKTPFRDDLSLLEYAAASLKDPAILELLLERGIPIDPNWKAAGFETPNVPLRKTLLERFSFPDWSKEPRIRLVTLEKGQNRNSSPEQDPAERLFPILADKAQNDGPKPLAEYLLEIMFPSQRRVGIPNATDVTLYRKNASGGLSPTIIRFDSADTFPTLEWGDILMVASPGQDYPTNAGQGRRPAQTVWNLRRHVSLRIEVELDGGKQSLAVRGDRVSYDPTEPVFPWSPDLSAAKLVGSLGWNPSENQPFQIHRKGWPQPIQLTLGSEAWKLKLLEGDRIVLPAASPNDESARKIRSSEVRLLSPGLWFGRSFPATEESTLPTLLQAIASAYRGDPQLSPYVSPPDPSKIVGELGSRNLVTSILPHPDLARIRIRRLNADGTETLVPVDLQKAAASCRETTSREEARKFDVELQAGDIIELPVKEGQQGKPWGGFSEAECRLFALALSCRIQISENSERSLRDIQFAPPKIIDTGNGLVSIPSVSGSPSIILADIQGEIRKIKLNRNGQAANKHSNQIFVRDGDEIDMGQGQPPRPRVIPPQR